MSYAFISGIPASGKSYLGRIVADRLGITHVDLDAFRKDMRDDPDLESWVSFYWNQDECEYWNTTSYDDHWANLVKQSEAMWPFLLQRINEIRKDRETVLFEYVNLLPHLAKKDLDFPGIYLLGESMTTISERLSALPRWGNSAALQLLEAKYFFFCEGKKYKEEADSFGYRTFRNTYEAEKELYRLFGN